MFVRFASFFSFVVIVFAVASAIQNIKADDAPVQKTNNDYVNSDKSGSYYISKQRSDLLNSHDEKAAKPTPTPSPYKDNENSFSTNGDNSESSEQQGFAKYKSTRPAVDPNTFPETSGIDTDSYLESNKTPRYYSDTPRPSNKSYIDSTFGSSSAIDRDIDNDGLWDFGNGGVDRDTDNDGLWDFDKGGVDRDADNDGLWDYGNGGVDRDTDNDGLWDYNKGGVDRDADNDGLWDAGNGGVDRDLDNDGLWDRKNR